MLPHQSISHYLLAREACQYDSFIERYQCRQLYRYIVPNQAAFDVACPNIAMKKFTMDGRYLVCFSRNQHSLHLYYYHPDSSCECMAEERKMTFDDFFVLKYEVVLTHGVELLCKDFCLFTHDHKFVRAFACVRMAFSSNPR